MSDESIGDESASDGSMSADRRFGWALAVVALGALALRVEYVLTARRDFHPGGDAYFYHAGANLLADGKGFISPFYVSAHVAAADHPPLYLLYLAFGSLLGLRSVTAHLLMSSVLGVGTVVLLGLLGRRVGGNVVGVIAALIGAVYPNMWAPDVGLLAETVSMFFVTLAVLLAFWYRDRPSWRRLALVGLACALGAMARSEIILFIPLLVFPLALATRDVSMRVGLVAFGAALAAAAIVITPWAAYNQTRFRHPVILSAQFGTLMASANCDSTYYYGPLQGYFDRQCYLAADRKAGVTPSGDESVEDIAARGSCSPTSAGTSRSCRRSREFGSCASWGCITRSSTSRRTVSSRAAARGSRVGGRTASTCSRCCRSRARSWYGGRGGFRCGRCWFRSAPCSSPCSSRTRARAFAPPWSRCSRFLPQSRCMPRWAPCAGRHRPGRRG